MTQKQVIVGIDVAKEKIDAAIRFGAETSFANSAEGRRELPAWLKEPGVGKAAMEGSGGYERGGGGSADRRPQAGAPLCQVGGAAGQERSDRCAHDRLVRRGVWPCIGPTA